MLFHPNPSPHQTRSQVLLQETKAENPYQYIKVVKKYENTKSTQVYQPIRIRTSIGPSTQKYLTKTYTCLGSKIPQKKKTKTKKNKKYIFRLKSQHAFEKK